VKPLTRVYRNPVREPCESRRRARGADRTITWGHWAGRPVIGCKGVCIVRRPFPWFFLFALLLLWIPGGALAQAQDVCAGPEGCCVFMPVQGANDAELASLYDQITKRMALGDDEIRRELDCRQEKSFNADTDNLNFQFYKTRCVSHHEANAYVAALAQQLRLSPSQQCAIRRIEHRKVNELAPLIRAYCVRRVKWMTEHYASAMIQPFQGTVITDTVIPYAVGGKTQTPRPAPKSRRIERNRDVK